MPFQKIEPCWPDRLDEIDTDVEEIRILHAKEGVVEQDTECCDVRINGQSQRIRFHDYHKVFDIPGLYELLFYEKLKCCSPSRVAHLLEDVIRDFEGDFTQLRILDVGAGNGMVGDELRTRGVDRIVGVDIIEQAKQAAHRDRPGVYDEYLVTDLTDLPEHHEERLRSHRFNCLCTVAALGFGDIPRDAFLKALDLLETPAWMAFNIKETFLHEQNDDSGFAQLIRQLSRQQIIQIQGYRRYRHRLSVTGQPLFYVAMIARKLKDIPDDLFKS